MAEFKLGDWCIDTKTERSVDVIAIIPAGENSITDLYVVQNSDSDYYIVNEERLVKYDKYYWEED